MDTLRTIDNIEEKKEDKKISKKLKKIKRKKSKFYSKNNFPPKKHNLNNSFYSDIGIKNKIERQLTTERELNSINDKFSSNEKKDKINKDQNSHYFSINEIINLNKNNNKKNIKKKFRNSFSNFSLNERKKEEFDDYYENKISRRSLFKIIKITPKNNKDKKINKTTFPLILILINANNKGDHYPLGSNYVLNNYDL